MEGERAGQGVGDRGRDPRHGQGAEMHRVRNVMGMVVYSGAIGGTKGHTVLVVSPQASATGAAGQGVTDLVQDGHTLWVVEPRGDRRRAVMYTAAPSERVEHPLMRWVGEAEEVRVERAEEIHTRAILRALESQMGRCAEDEEADDIKEQIQLALNWVDSSSEENEPRWILLPGAEEVTRREALARARRLVEEMRKQCLEVEDDPEGERLRKWRGLRRGRRGQMRFIVGDGDDGEQGGGEEGPAQEEEGREPGQEADRQVEQEGEREGVEHLCF